MRVCEASNGVKLIQARNPWGEREWKGDWSDSSPLWTAELKKELDWENKDDGIFWMSLEDFVDQFTHFYGVRLYEDEFGKKWQHLTIRDEWTGSTSGGSVNHESYFKNPQYYVQ